MEDAFKIMDRTLEHGINFWDTANVHGQKKGEGVTEQILGRYFAQGRRDPIEAILARSPFPQVEVIERVYQAPLRPAVEALIGNEYSISHVLGMLGDRREAFEREVGAELGDMDEMGEFWVTWRDEALIGVRERLSA